MKIEKILNNNVVTIIDEDGIEQVIMGKGIAFKKVFGDKIEEKKIEKIFKLDSKNASERFKSLLNETPMEYVEISRNIIKYAEKTLEKKFEDVIFLALTDHLNFAMKRMKKGLPIKNEMLWEIKRIYRKEYSIGIWSINYIKYKLGVDLPEDEAGFIALHIINATLGESMPNTMNITKLIQDILSIVKYHYKIDVDEEALSFHRFVTHLKFFAQRMFSKKQELSGDDSLYEVVKDKYNESYLCVKKIRDYIKITYDYELTSEEMVYLVLHVQRLTKDKSVASNT
ncbi:BglG family transcription antiterminator LicT [Clostridium folliculivorans]|uniref:Transcription antiterminator LicT n=1 Tax=Clostridium folliculivorans TaxID=2886038 RepID=A0A9W6DBS2_9CLOT|nr:PRD domain-containing protein [Clostridium folliculivorans]GKU26745.1 transcription antiterminator LicT [Clostridium folliculivorans]GKU31339.1 transcription antiterminator LicT [Clostridium folliculivorans]